MSAEGSPRVVSIVYTPSGSKRQPQGHYTRIPIDRAKLIEFRGIDGDLKGGTGNRQLNIMLAETLMELRVEGFKTAPGELGEQIVIAGISMESLIPGVKVRLGKAVIEVTIPRTGCARFEAIQGKSKESVKGRLGVLARVVIGGEIAVGDGVELLSA